MNLENRTIYDLVGGSKTFEDLAEAFYRRVEGEALIRPMYPENLTDSVGALALFLAQFFGGPQSYSALRGHPRLKMRHLPFKIGEAERNAWLTHMLASIDEIRIQEPMRSLMRQYFKDTSAFLINTPKAE